MKIKFKGSKMVFHYADVGIIEKQADGKLYIQLQLSAVARASLLAESYSIAHLENGMAYRLSKGFYGGYIVEVEDAD